MVLYKRKRYPRELGGNMETVVISLGGSIIIPDQGDSDFLKRFSALLKKLAKEYRLFMVCGGGKIARYYINTGRGLHASEEQLDEMGIEVTRINARLLQLALGEAAVESIPKTIEESVSIAEAGHVVVMGGTVPGHTTDCVAASLAEAIGADRIVNATSVDGVYSADPKTDPTAIRYSHLNFEQFKGMMTSDVHGAGRSGVFDPLGCQVLQRTHIPVFVVSGRDLEEIESAIRGKGIKGTIISDGPRSK